MRIVFTIIVLWTTSCNLPIQMTSTPPATPIPATPSPIFSTPTLIPIETLLARATSTRLPTPTPRLVLAAPINQPVNCRYGPSTAYAIVGGLEVGKQTEIVAKNIDVTWWYVKNPNDPSTFCWLAADLIHVEGSADALPVEKAPLAQVTNIQVRVEPASMNISCNGFPQYVIVNADIYTNGPASVEWAWETSEGEVFDRDTILFLEAGSQSVFVPYKINKAKDYWIQVHIRSPNDTTGRAFFKATCVP